MGRPNGFTLHVRERRVRLVVGGEECGGVGKEGAERGGVCEQDGGEGEVGMEDGGHVSEERQLPQFLVAASVVGGEQNHVHWRVLGGSGVMDGGSVCLTENVTLLQCNGFGSGLVDHRSWFDSWTELFRWMKRERGSGYIQRIVLPKRFMSPFTSRYKNNTKLILLLFLIHSYNPLR